MVKEPLFIGPRLYGVDAGITFGVWTSAEGSRFWRRTIGGATYDFSVYACGHVTVARYGPRLDRKLVHSFYLDGSTA